MRTTLKSQGRKSDIGRSYVFYESLKTNLVQFPPKPLTRGLRAKSQDANMRKLMQQIHELENYKKISDEKLKIYEHQIEELMDQLGRMHSINKQLLHSKLAVNPAEVEFIVSELQNSEIKGKVSHLTVENDKYRTEIENLQNQVNRLIKENKHLEDQKIESMKNVGIAEAVSLKSIEERLTTPRINFSRNIDKSRFGVKNLQMLHKAIADMSAATNFVSLLSSLGASIKRTLDCDKCTIYLASNFAQRLYLDANDPQSPVQKINVGGNWVLIHNDIYLNSEIPVFSRIEDTVNGMRSGQDLVEPALINKEIALVVQCQSSFKGMFEQNDEVQLRIMLENCVASSRSFISKRKEEMLQDHLSEVTNICAAFARSRSYHYLANTVNSLLPSFFDFEAAEILYIDENSSEFYGITHNQTIHKFPFFTGITGEAYESRTMKIYDSFSKKEPVADIDNFAGVEEISNLMVVCLLGPNRKILGVLQLYNKVNNNISPKDIQNVGEMSIILGSVIAMLAELKS